MENWSAVVRTCQESARLSVGTAWHMKMWVQLWFENIMIKNCVIHFIGAPLNEAVRAFNFRCLTC